MSALNKSFVSFFVRQPQRPAQPRLCHSLVPQQFYSSKKQYHSWLVSLLPALAFLIVFSSCEKVIDVNLNDAEKKYVIEAVITDQENSCRVLLSQTKAFGDNNVFNGISGAQITIADNNLAPVTLTETSTGVYKAPGLKGISGHSYHLTVAVNGTTFTANSKLPALVPFDSLFISERNIFGEVDKFATVVHTDPPGRGNAYRYIQYLNGVKEKTIFVRDDDFTEGRAITRDLLYFNDDDDSDATKIKTGDSVRVELQCIDYPIYKYWYSLAQSSTGEDNSATPANPVTNIQGGALGYFSAHTLQSRSVIVK